MQKHSNMFAEKEKKRKKKTKFKSVHGIAVDSRMNEKETKQNDKFM